MHVRGPKSQLDWLAVVGLWVGALILAVREGQLPLIEGAPAFLSSRIWNLVPLLLITVALLIFIYRQVRPIDTVAPKTPSKEATPEPAPERSHSEATKARPQPPSTDERIYVSGKVGPYDLMAKCEGKTRHQAKREVSHFIGKWIRVEGIFEDLDIRPGFASVTLVRREMANIMGTSLPDPRTILFYFRKDFDRLEMIEPGQRVIIDGKIDEIDSFTFKLEDCELVEVD